MKRLAAIVAGAAVAVAILAAGRTEHADVAALQRAKEVTLVYIGAEDCAPCRIWQRETEAEIQTSAKFARLTYRAVKSPALFDLMDDKHWPEDLRGYRDRLVPGAGAPTWLIIADGALVIKAAGASQWRDAVLPRLESLMR